MTPPQKACKRCGEVKPLEQFHRQRAGKDGRMATCRTCNLARQRAYYQAHCERIKARVMERYYTVIRPLLEERWHLSDRSPQPPRCSRCRQVKPVEAFYAGGRKDGTTSWCKICYQTHRKR